MAVIAEEEAQFEKAKKEAEKLKRKGTSKISNSNITEEDKNAEDVEIGEESKKGSEKDDQEDDGDDEYDFAYRVYFRKEEIMMAAQ